MGKVSQATDQHHPHLGFLVDPLSTILKEAPVAAAMEILSVGQVQVQEIAAGPASHA